MLPFAKLREAELELIGLQKHIGHSSASFPDKIIHKFLIVPFDDKGHMDFMDMYHRNDWKEEGIIARVCDENTIFTIYIQYRSIFPDLDWIPYSKNLV